MRISAIVQQKHNANRYNVFVEGEYAVSLEGNQILDLGIAVDDECTEQQISQWAELSEYSKNIAGVIAKLSRRQHSRREIERYLQKKGLSAEEITTALNYLDDKNYLDDAAFADELVQQLRRKYKSKKSIAYELRKRGIDESVARQVLNKISDTSEYIAEYILQKRLQNRYKTSEKLLRFLVSKGFSYHDVKQGLMELAERS